MPGIRKNKVWTGPKPRPIYLCLLILLCTLQVLALTLKEKAEIDTEQIYLRDLIVEAKAEYPWAEIVVWQSPSLNSKRPIYKSFVISLFRKHGYILEAENLVGPNKVDVYRMQGVQNNQGKENIKSLTVDYQNLWAEVEKQLSFHLTELIPSEYIFEIIPEKRPEEIPWPETTSAVLVDLAFLRNLNYGKMAIPVDALLVNGQKKRLMIMVVIEYEGMVFAARRDFRPREQLNEVSVTQEYMRFSQNPNNLFTTSRELNFYQAKNLIRKGDILLQNHVELRPIKYKGETTKLVYKRGSLMLEVLVELLEDAIIGKKVRSVNLTSGKEIVGLVKEDGSLVIEP